MSLPPLATVDDLIDWIGEPISEATDLTRAEGTLALASALVRRETERTWVDDEGNLAANLPDDVRLVTLACAARGYLNPEGVVDESIDDYRGRKIVQEAGLYLTASERDLLAPLAGRPHQGLGTVATTRGERAPFDLAWEEGERLLPPYY